MKRASKTWIRDVVAAAALGVTIAVGLAVSDAPDPGRRAGAPSASLTRGTHYLAELQARFQYGGDAPRSAPALRSDALQAIYLARIETGLGSPFRAIEAALRDPWLPDSVRPELANAMLANALTITPTAPGRYALDSAHAALVDSVVRTYAEPRQGEEVVRVAFDLAAASGAISHAEAAAASEVAAVARDAAYTRRDVARLITAAHRGGLTPLDLLPLWRKERRFDVERPIVFPTAWASSRELVWNAARLFERLDAHIAQPSIGGAGAGSSEQTVRRAGGGGNVVLRQAARELARERNMPSAPAILQVTGGLPASRPLNVPTTEEELAAAWLAVPSLTPSEQRVWSRAMTAAAVKLRVTAQDDVWFEGDQAPTVTELRQRHGLRAITFASVLRPAWRDYALHSIDRALNDARRVLPDLDLRGLRIHVGVKADWPSRAMALHDPVARTIYFPLGTAPGVLAHELGHDLDWQVARSVFREQGIYATDGTARRESDILAAPVERLTGASALGSGAGGAGGGSFVTGRHAGGMRPTEVLARHVDWLTAAALATMGRSNGFLSTVQEFGDALGNTSRPDPSQIDAAVSVVSTATPVPNRTVAQVHAAAGRAPLVREVVQRALATNLRGPWSRRGTSRFDALGIAAVALRQSVDPRLARRCVAGSARAAGEPEWVGDVYALVAGARAREAIRRVHQGMARGRRPLTREATAAGGAALRGAFSAGPVDPALRAQGIALLRREIEWHLNATMAAPLTRASAVPSCSN